MGAMHTEPFEGEEGFELWDGEIVMKGQPQPWHEAIRAAVVSALFGQCPDLSVVTTSALGDDRTFAVSDGSVRDTRVSPALEVLWIEVFSAADLRREERRLNSGRRRLFLQAHGVRTIWTFVQSLGVVMLHVHDTETGVAAFAPPGTVEQTLRDSAGERTVAVDLGLLQRAGELAGDD